MIKIHIKRFDTSLPLPEYKSSGAAAFDLYARKTVTIPPQEILYVPLNIAVQLPADHFALLAARSSLPKKGLMMANGIGVGDHDFRGDNDEYQAVLFNFTQKPVTIEKGERIVQMIILPREKAEFVELQKFTDKDRGGFGSTGKK
jgi:dUTP pyrophosphatase